ncbi:MAG: adenylate/guanylate cyclase domain-containing protein [Rhodoferax sp.]
MQPEDASPRPTILIVDDAPANAALLVEMLQGEFRTQVALRGEEALQRARAAQPPDLILLDIMMPGLDGYAVCRSLQGDAATRDIPVIFVSTLDAPDDEARGLALGAVDYVTRPLRPAIVRQRVRTQLALARQARDLRQMVAQREAQAAELVRLNHTLEERVAEGIREVERLARLKRYFSPAVVDLMLTQGVEDPLKSHRREVAAAFVDLRGFTAFTETSDPEDVMQVMREYHESMGQMVMAFGGTLEHFAGDGMMIYFNDPIEVDNPAGLAVHMALAMQQRFATLGVDWQRRGYDLSLGIGVAFGYATIGAIGFEGRRDYGVIGNVTNLAARLCAEAAGGQILVSQRVHNQVGALVRMAPLGDMALKGFHRPMPVYAVLGHLDPAAGAPA